MSDEPSDENLMLAYLDGDQRAFEKLFRRLAPRLRAFFARSFRGHEPVQELVQQTFLQLHRARGQFHRDAKVRPWVFTIAGSVRIDELRRRRRVPESAGVEELESLEDSSPAADDQLSAHHDAKDMRDAVERLAPSLRVVLQLHRFEELTFAEIAGILKTSEGAVRVRASRAYALLRELLTPTTGAPS
jgi:RNA polymerase sigma-70 factor (ECF subfamily)